ncbi:MAG: DUF4102 domain-containing protein [Betaproteobacteria bacterium]|nr:DUF4102 domain-containing protein [Betaproteobacteria bacterium]
MLYPRNALKPASIDTLQPSLRPYKASDGGGLYLLVHPNGSKYWRLNYRFDGKAKTLALGVYPDVSLAKARERRNEAREMLAVGVDPSDLARKAQEERHNERLRQEIANRFTLDSDGALHLRLGRRYLVLTAAETNDLRHFLHTQPAGSQG